ncbi:MAG: META domain-containing protein [Cardiobacteriaceae bacterium]|nr:META domain-containing protein [Cardiobacteriaceae bacterium]
MKNPILLLGASLALAACQTNGQAPDHPVIPPASAQTWQLEHGQLGGKTLNLAASPEPVTLTMQSNLLTGKSPVNHYNAPANIGGNTLRITGPIMTTRMAANAAAMHLESDYLQALQKAERYDKSGNRLIIEGADARLEYGLRP